MDVSERLLQLQNNFGWSDYKLAKKSGVPSSTISSIHSRKSYPTVDTMEPLCNALGVTLSQFFAQDELVELTPDQKELFDKWLLLNPVQKEAVHMMIDAFTKKIED